MARGNPATAPHRIARKAYDAGFDAGRRDLATERNEATIYRAALWGLGSMHRDAPPACIAEAGYDMAAVWGRLDDHFRGQAILVCLAAGSEADDCGGAPEWMGEYEDEEKVPW